MHRTNWTQTALVALLLLLLAVTVSQAAGLELQNLQENCPLRMQDATAIPAQVTVADFVLEVGIDDSPTIGDWVKTRLQVDYGFGHGLQASVGRRTVSSDTDETGNGDIYLAALQEVYKGPRDSAAVNLEVDLPTGQDYARWDRSVPGYPNPVPPIALKIDPRDQSVDFRLGAVYTRVLDDKPLTRLHAQASYSFLDSAQGTRSRGRWFLSAGADRQVTSDTLAMVNFLFEEKPWRWGDDSAILQLGLRHQVNSRLLCGVGYSMAFGWEEADYAATVSAEYGF